MLQDRSLATINSREDASGKVPVSSSIRDTICDGGKSNLTEFNENVNPEKSTTKKTLHSRSSEATAGVTRSKASARPKGSKRTPTTLKGVAQPYTFC